VRCISPRCCSRIRRFAYVSRAMLMMCTVLLTYGRQQIVHVRMVPKILISGLIKTLEPDMIRPN
jgi:hypothetical protein